MITQVRGIFAFEHLDFAEIDQRGFDAGESLVHDGGDVTAGVGKITRDKILGVDGTLQHLDGVGRPKFRVEEFHALRSL